MIPWRAEGSRWGEIVNYIYEREDFQKKSEDLIIKKTCKIVIFQAPSNQRENYKLQAQRQIQRKSLIF